MDGDAVRRRVVRDRTVLIVGATAGAALLTTILVVVGGMLVAFVAPARTSADWQRWADVGQAFGLFSTVLSGMAFVALVVTLWVQMRELSLQRAELRLQRTVAERSGEELRRSAAAGVRLLHFELLKMSIEDPALARVWPETYGDGDQEKRRQMVYANLVFQHAAMSMLLADYTDEQVRESLRYLFASPIMRAYWIEATPGRRQTQQAGSDLWRIAQIGDAVVAEFAGPDSERGDHPG